MTACHRTDSATSRTTGDRLAFREVLEPAPGHGGCADHRECEMNTAELSLTRVAMRPGEGPFASRMPFGNRAPRAASRGGLA